MSKGRGGALTPRMEEALFDLMEGPLVSARGGFAPADREGPVRPGGPVMLLVRSRLAEARRLQGERRRTVVATLAGQDLAETLLQ